MHTPARQRGKIGTAALVIFIVVGAVLALAAFAVPKYNRLQVLDQNVKAQWSEVVNQYQRRADLIPNLVAVVKRYAEHEQGVFTEVANARAKIGSVNVNAASLTAANLQQFQQAQSSMTAALSHLIAVSENYPELKANTVFQDLQAQLEGTENRVATARNRYIESVREYNISVRQFPMNLVAGIAGLREKPNFAVENEKAISTAPQVSF